MCVCVCVCVCALFLLSAADFEMQFLFAYCDVYLFIVYVTCASYIIVRNLNKVSEENVLC